MEVINTTSTTDPSFYYNYLNNLVLNPIVLIIIVVILILFLVFSYSLGSDTSTSDNTGSFSSSNSIMTAIIMIVLLCLILVNAFQYFFSVNIIAYVKNLFQPNTQIDIVVDQTTFKPSPVPEIKFRKQVFNIPGNYYNYENAKALCKAYGSTLATYDQVENSYNSGGEWCNYGWSEGQMALFPTQKSTYDKLQTIPGHEHDCGRPGINGGYIANPQVKFGVNCYGNKPRITEEEDELMKTMPKYPQNMKDLVFDKRVDFWKRQLSEILVSPFNHDSWTQI
jgi:hypothetical protein